MSNDIGGWFELAIFLAGHSIIPLVSEWVASRRRRSRSRVHYRSFKAWGIEWTSYDRDDDLQS